MDTTQWIFFIATVVIILVFVYIDSMRKAKARTQKILENGWGKMPKKEYTYEEYENISHYFRNDKNGDGVIDDITWNDLDMDRIFKMMNNTHSSVGQEYLYKMLRMPNKSNKYASENDRISRFFSKDTNKRIKIQKEFVRLGYARHISVTDYIDLIVDLKPKSSLIHFITNILIVLALIFCIFVNAQFGIVAVIAACGVSIVSYYKCKAEVEHYFVCVKHIVKMVMAAERIAKLNIPELSDYNLSLKKLAKSFDRIVRTSSMLSSESGVNGSLGEMLLDYVRMITHIDLIKFNNMISFLNTKEKEIYGLIDMLGRIEACIAVASFRTLLPYWTEPELTHDNQCNLQLKDVYHPLIEDPVTNSIDTDRSVLLTGSNASGKSTFLKTVAINALLSQAIQTSVSRGYTAPYFEIYSSMALKDDLGNSESYYIVEIKSLKRILDAIDRSESPVMCFVDEVLRGTNTVERIAASSQILKSLALKNVMCFAATHDIELTSILENYYANYHFQEEVSEDDIHFNYKLFDGRATSRNAIKLLGIIGYGQEIIKASDNAAKRFVSDGVWTIEQ